MSPIDPRPSWVRQRTYELQLTGMRWIDARKQAEAEADEKFGAEENGDNGNGNGNGATG